jgi:Holliday junction DNA helicase RuvA
LGPAAAAVPAEDHSAWAAAREALAGLGYRDAELDRVWLTLKDQVGPDETPEALMKKALRQLYQG